MLINNLQLAIIQLKKYPFFSIISIISLTIGIASTILIYLWIQNEYSYEKFHKNSDEIYRVLHLKNESGQIVKSDRSLLPLAAALCSDFPQIENATLIKYEGEIHFRCGEHLYQEEISLVDAQFFKIFSFPVVEGDPIEAMQSTNVVVITDVVAKKIFGEEPALGKTIRLLDYKNIECVVGAVISVPAQSHIGLSIVISIKWYETSPASFLLNSWTKGENTVVYVKMVKNARFNSQTRKDLQDYLSKHQKNHDKLLFQPLKDIHLHSDFFSYNDKNRGNYKNIFIVAGLALLILSMGAFNFTVLETALGSQRGKEVAIRKVYGASILALLSQFFSETILKSVIALCLAVVTIYLTLPFFNQLADVKLELVFSVTTIISLFVIGIISALFAGAYPAFFLTSLSPFKAFRGGSKKGITSILVKQLVLFQFTISVIMIISTITIQKQLHYTKTADLGLDKKDIVIFHTGLYYHINSLKKVILENSYIKAVSIGSAIDNWVWEGNFKWFGQNNAPDSARMNMIWVDGDFDKVYGLKMLDGEFLKGDFDSYWTNSEHQAVINEEAAKLIGIENPIGIKIRVPLWGDFTICGIVKNFHFRPLHEPLAPLVMFYSPETIEKVHVKIVPGSETETLNYLKTTYERMRPDHVFDYQFFENILDNNYRVEKNVGNIFILFSLLSILISILGILGMLTFSTERRVKEISLRKINGAKAFDINFLFLKEYIIWVLVAIVIAIPIAWYFINLWLKNFAFKTGLSWWIFVSAGFIVVLIAVVTVYVQTFRAARTNCIVGLRKE
ncbi:MAG: ABC transporter permease [Marinilabiliaceae bacterium]|nr:ABC transporter permease [Marinilabiliaceae bacterium]